MAEPGMKPGSAIFGSRCLVELISFDGALPVVQEGDHGINAIDGPGYNRAGLIRPFFNIRITSPLPLLNSSRFFLKGAKNST